MVRRSDPPRCGNCRGLNPKKRCENGMFDSIILVRRVPDDLSRFQVSESFSHISSIDNVVEKIEPPKGLEVLPNRIFIFAVNNRDLLEFAQRLAADIYRGKVRPYQDHAFIFR